MIVAELRITPLGEGTSLDEPVREVLDVLDEQGIRYEVGPMGTTLETRTLHELLEAVQACHAAVREHSGRILTEVAIDDRRDVPETIESLKDID